jgi:hypothetical protein
VRSAGEVGGGGGVTKHVARRMRYPRKKTKNAPSAVVGARNSSAAGKVMFFFCGIRWGKGVLGAERNIYIYIYNMYIQI